VGRRSCGLLNSTRTISSGSANHQTDVPPRPLPWVFPYVVEREAEDHPLGRTVLRPLVEVRVRGPGGISNKYAALVDSGSDYTLAAPIVALEAGVDLRSGRQTAVQVGGGHRSISVVDTTLQLCDPQFGQEGGSANRQALTTFRPRLASSSTGTIPPSWSSSARSASLIVSRCR
jgi:hypothetical protein